MQTTWGAPGNTTNDFTWLPGSPAAIVPNTPSGSPSTGYSFPCTVTAEYTVSDICDNNECATIPGNVCGQCAQHASCTRYDSSCGTAVTYGRVGTTRASMASGLCQGNTTPGCAQSVVAAQCLTGDELTDPGAKATRLVNWLGSNLSAPTAADPNVVNKLTSALQLGYEISGGSFTAAQRSTARTTYVTRPNLLTCGNRPSPQTLGLCPSSDWLLTYCARMSSEHVTDALLWDRAAHTGDVDIGARCAGLLAQLDAASCPAAVIEEGFAVERALIDRLGRRFQTDFTTDRCNAGSSTARRAAASRMFGFVDQWHAATQPAAGPAPSPVTSTRLDDALSASLGDTWRRVDRAFRFEDILLQSIAEDAALVPCPAQPNQPPDQVDVLSILESGARRAGAAYQDLVAGAMTSLNGVPLLAALGHILQAEIGRLEAQRSSHDLACRFTECKPPDAPARQTQVAYLYRLFSLLDRRSDGLAPGPNRPEDLRDAINDPVRPVEAAAWRDSFAVVEANHARVTNALGILTGATYNPSQLDTLVLSAVPGSTRDFIEGLRRAKTRYRSYAASGLFSHPAGRYLRTPINFARRQEIIDVLGRVNGPPGPLQTLGQRLENFHDDISVAIQQMASATTNQGSIAQIALRRSQLFVELDRVDSKRDAHARAARGEDIGDQIKQAWLDVEGRLTTSGTPVQFFQLQQYPPIGSPLGAPIPVSGLDAPMDRSTSVANLAVVWNGTASASKITAAPGQIVSIAVPPQDQWAPKCSLESSRVYDEAGAVDTLVAPLTGPGGYSLVTQGSNFVATSDSDSFTETHGFNESVCASLGLGVPLVSGFLSFGASASACFAASQTWSHDSRTTTGTDSRTSASFVGGLYLPQITPFIAPVGSLLLVEMPAGVTSLLQVRDVHVIRSPSSTIVVRDDPSHAGSDFYLVVNDFRRRCTVAGTSPDSSNKLNLTIQRMWSAEAHARATLDAMGDVITFVRAAEPNLVKQGDILPGQLESIVNDATNLMPAAVRSAASYPPALREVFEGLILAEKVRLEHAVKLANLEEAHDRILDQLNLLSSDQQYAQHSGNLLRLLPRWSARNLDIDQLEADTAAVTELLAEFIFPILETWYPQVLGNLRTPGSDTAAAIDALAQQSSGTSLYQLSEHVRTVGNFIAGALPTADLENEFDTATVGLSFRRPGSGTYDPLIGPQEGPMTPFSRAEPARANAVWAAIESGEPVTLHVQPEDLYRRGVGYYAPLSCRAARPILRKIGLALVDPNRQFLENQVGLLLVPVDITLGANQTFATPTGPLTYELIGDGAENTLRGIANIPFVPANESIASVGFAASMVSESWDASDLPIGRSPFGSFTFQIVPSALSPFGPITPNDLATATELVLYMEVEFERVSEELPWVSTCKAEASSCTDGFDNDSNGLTDCADTACAGSPACGEVCGDSLDNDGNGLTDCADVSICGNTVACCPGAANGELCL